MGHSRKYYQKKENIFDKASGICLLIMIAILFIAICFLFINIWFSLCFFACSLLCLIGCFVFWFVSQSYSKKVYNWMPDRELPVEIGTIKNLKIDSGQDGYYIQFDLFDYENQKIKHVSFKTSNLVSMEKIRKLTEIPFNYIDKEEKDIYFPKLPSDVTVVIMPYRFKYLEK